MTFYFQSPILGATDITFINTVAPGIANLPSNVYEPQIGEIRQGWDTTLGSAEFIYLKIPASTTLSAGNIVYWTAGYTATILPVITTSKNSLFQLAVAPVAVASSTAIQYGWFQISGQATVLKTAVTVSPKVTVFASTTTGRLKVLASAGGQILGMLTANLATVTSTTSTVLVFLNRPQMQGQIT